MRGRVFRRGRTWSFVVDVGRDSSSGRRRQRTKGGYATRREAEDALARLVAGVESLAPERSSTGGLTVAGFLEQWLVAVIGTVKPSTAQDYRYKAEHYLIPRLRRVELRALTPLDVRTLWADLASSGGRDGHPLSANSVRGIQRVLRKALNDALDWELIDRNPTLRVKLPRSTTAAVRSWTVAETRRFLDAVEHDRLAALWVLAVTTGMRRGELAGLRWVDVDLDAAMIHVRNTRVSVAHKVHEHDPKTRSSKRMVALDDRSVACLRAHRRHQLEERLAWGPAYVESGYVFTVENGAPIHPERIGVLFHRILRGLDLPRIRLHDLRHTSASLMLAAGVHPKIVSERLGHSSISVTLDLYSHVIPGLQADAAERLGDLVFGG